VDLSFEGADVRAVNADPMGEFFLAEAGCLAVPLQVCSQDRSNLHPRESTAL